MLLAHALVKPAWVLAEMWLQNQMGHTQYGTFSALFQLAFIISPVLDMGTALLLTRYYAANIGAVHDAHAIQLYTQNVIKLRSWLAVAYFLLVVIAGILLGYTAHPEWRYCLLLLAGYNVGVGALIFMRAQFQGQLMFRAEAFAGVADRLGLMLMLLAVAALGISITPTLFGMLLLGSAILAVMGVGLMHGVSRFPFALGFTPKTISTLTPYLMAGVPLTVMLTVSAVNERIPELLIERLQGAEANSLFAAAHRWYKAANMYLWTILPVFYARFAAGQLPDNNPKKLLGYGTYIVALPVAAFGAIMAWYPAVFTFLLRNSTATELVMIHQHLRLLAVPLTLHAWVAIYGTQLTAAGHLRALITIHLCAATTHAISGLLLLHYYGAQAAPLAIWISVGVVGAGYLYAHTRLTSTAIGWPVLIRLILAVGMMHAILAAFHQIAAPLWVALPTAWLVLLAVGVPLRTWHAAYLTLLTRPRN